MARSVKDIQYDPEEAQWAISGYRTLLSGGTVQKGSVSEGRYKGYIYDHQQKIKALKSELAEAKKAGFSNSFSLGQQRALNAIANKAEAVGVRLENKKLQVRKGGEWKYVFAHNPVQGIIVTDDPGKALGPDALGYFQSKHANDEFRIG